MSGTTKQSDQNSVRQDQLVSLRWWVNGWYRSGIEHLAEGTWSQLKRASHREDVARLRLDRFKLQWDHPQFYPVRCLRCNWTGMSNEAAGGNQIADTGDHNDIVCPHCIAPNGDYEAGLWVTLEEIPSPNAAPSATEAGR
jgi:hypothetical protein